MLLAVGLLLVFCCCLIISGGAGFYYYRKKKADDKKKAEEAEAEAKKKAAAAKAKAAAEAAAKAKAAGDSGAKPAEVVAAKEPKPAEEVEVPVQAPAFEVGDKVKLDWKLPDSARDLCAPTSGQSHAYGTVKRVENDGAVHVQWELVKTPSPRSGLNAHECCWKRSPTNDTWNLKYWGDVGKEPTYDSGLKSGYSASDAKIHLKKDSSGGNCPVGPGAPTPQIVDVPKQIKPRPTSMGDCGYPNKTRGWYDMQGQGAKNDFCRFVGNWPGYFSCQLAGTTTNTPRGTYPDAKANDPHDPYTSGFTGHNCGASAIADAADEYTTYKTKANTGMCLDVSGRGTANGTNVQVYQCNNTPAQSFKYEPSTKLIRYKQAPNKCLHAYGSDQLTNGQNITIWDCINGHPRFTWDKVGNTFKLKGTNKCMHVYGSDNITNHQNVTLWDCLPTWKRFQWE